MAKRGSLDSGSEPEASENSSSDEEEEEEESGDPSSSGNGEKQGMSEYEKQRQSRIADNKARMEALGLHKKASSLMGLTPKSSPRQKFNLYKGKRKVDDDEDYRPIDEDDKDDDDDDDDDNVASDDDDDEDFVGSGSSSKARRNKVKKRSPQPKKKLPVQKHLSSADYIDEDNDDLMQAIALSLQDSATDATPKERKGSSQGQKDSGKRKKRKSFSSRLKMTEDEIDLHFFQIDEAGRGVLTIKDLNRVATAHDFMWTDKELADMIHVFDSDKDGKLNLDDFRKIVDRCNMVQRSESS